MVLSVNSSVPAELVPAGELWVTMPAGELWVTIKPGSDTILRQALRQLVELSDDGWEESRTHYDT